MLKNQTVNTNSHLLTLYRVDNTNCDPLLQANFSPIQTTSNSSSILPHFNLDRQHFTPAFVLPCDQKFYRENLNFERLKFDERIQNAQEKSIIGVGLSGTQKQAPRAPPRNFCQLCKTHFIDYQLHISLPAHRQYQSNCLGNSYIRDVVSLFKKKRPAKKGALKPTQAVCKKAKIKKVETRVVSKMNTRSGLRSTTFSKNSIGSTNLEQQLV